MENGYRISAILILGMLVIQDVWSSPLCVPCGSGSGVVRPCTDSQTLCEPCTEGYFASVQSYNSPCRKCTECSMDEYQHVPCTPTSDTICRRCDWNVDNNTENRKLCQPELKVIGTKVRSIEPIKSAENSIPVNKHEEVFDRSIRSLTSTDPEEDGEDGGSGFHASAVVLPDWQGSGEVDKDLYEFVQVGKSSESFEDLLEGEELLPDVTSPELDTGSGSGVGPIYTTREPAIRAEKGREQGLERGISRVSTEDKGETSTTPKPGLTRESRHPLNKKVRTGIIVAAVVAGAVVLIVTFYCLASWLSKRRRKNNKDGYTYVSAPQQGGDDHLARPNTVAWVHSEGTIPSGETTPLSAHNGGPVHQGTDGKYLSPINIVHGDVTVDTSLKKSPLCFDYPSETNPKVSNTGNTVKVALENKQAVLRGGPLRTKSYRLSHCHFHWGSKDSQGSEHTVDGKQYPAELHLVHWNTTDYSTEAEACRSTDGLAVLSVFIKIGCPHETLGRVAECLQNVQHKGETTVISGQPFSATALLPDNRCDYWTYKGSMPEAPQINSVVWVVFKHNIEVSAEQLDNFRQLRDYEKDEGHGSDVTKSLLVDNFRRPVALTGGSTVYASFV